MQEIELKTALISVSDKTGIEQLGQALDKAGITIYSTGGTALHLEQAGITIHRLENLTDYPEMLDGRVKTLQPAIHGGILADRDAHTSEIDRYQLPLFDLVVCNLYPFEATAQVTDDYTVLVENIDIGGPAMLRAAAKNYRYVTPVCHSDDYTIIETAVKQNEGVPLATRQRLAQKVFAHTAYYDSLVARTLMTDTDEDGAHDYLTQSWKLQTPLRYGENPHQKALLYQDPLASFDWLSIQKQGKAMSYNNYMDAQAAINIVREFEAPACIIIKHGNACGAAIADTIDTAFEDAWASDSQAAFGSIIAINQPCTAALAQKLGRLFIEVFIAPSFVPEAVSHLSQKPNLRVLETGQSFYRQHRGWHYTQLDGALLTQQMDDQQWPEDSIEQVTRAELTNDQLKTAAFGWPVLKHLHSNAIIIAQGSRTIGIGAGCVARIDALKLAMDKTDTDLSGAVLLSDGFLPFRDIIDYVGRTNLNGIVQPGGSKNDQKVIDACNEYGIAMVFTHKRCFNH